MAQDAFSKMAEDSWLLKEDGYLNADTDLKKITYHPSLNVIIICTKSGIVKVLDVNSGVVLHSSDLSAQNQKEVTCRYIVGQDRILFSDGQALGVRSDYNGVLLLDTILQRPVANPRNVVRLELLLSEAIILKQSLAAARVAGSDQVINHITEKILEAQKHSKKGIKAQKWNTVCLELPLEPLRSLASSTVSELLMKNQHTPELGVTSAVQERLSDLAGEQATAADRRAMASEAKRRETFSLWPHMDYKWALPDQMAQAGFYHQPNASGEDRAMCFTCTVCLVCWERTDEPWSEHERHSPSCPFVMGEYTQNVPLSTTYATNPAADATYQGVPVCTLGTSSIPELFAVANEESLISVFDVSGKVKRTQSFYVTQFDSHILERFTQDFGVARLWIENEEVKNPAEKKVTALAIVGEKPAPKTASASSTACHAPAVRPTLICGLSIRCRPTSSAAKITYQLPSSVEALNDQNKKDALAPSDYIMDEEMSCLYLAVYDFQYRRNPALVFTKVQDAEGKKEVNASENGGTNQAQDVKSWNYLSGYPNSSDLDYMALDIAITDKMKPKDFEPYVKKKLKENEDAYNLLKQHMQYYQSLVPGESDEIFIPPVLSTSKLRTLGNEDVGTFGLNSETDAAQTPSLLISQAQDLGHKSISDSIADLGAKKLSYSRAVQCLSLPARIRGRKDLEICDVIPTVDGGHVLVVVTSTSDAETNFLLLYELNFASMMVKLEETPLFVRELNANERPVEVGLLTQLERVCLASENSGKEGVQGTAIVVCADGSVHIVELATLKTISVAKLDKEKFISATYCNSLERLCASTEKGSLHFYTLNDADSESTEDHEEEDLLTSMNYECASGNVRMESSDSGESMRCFREPIEPVCMSELRRLHALCGFEPLKTGYCAVVPPCWSEMQQLQRQRRHPHGAQTEGDQNTKTWRLQTDTTTWDEHIFEVTLPSPMCLGHVDVYFTLHSSSAAPHVEVTLLRQNTSGIGHRRDVKFSVDETVSFDALQCADNPVITQEYLRAHNAEILAGPVNLSSSLDLTEQGGCVTLTSPKLFKSRTRTLLLHVKAVYPKDTEPNKDALFKKRPFEARTSTTTASVDYLPVTTTTATASGGRKTEFYMGCDCLHEISITVFGSKFTDVPHERSVRNSVLDSNVFAHGLICTATNADAFEARNMALDVLNWCAAIRLTRNRSFNGEAPPQQIEFLKVVQGSLGELLRECLLLAGRSVARKCIKLVVTCSNGAKNINDVISNMFDTSILDALMDILDSINTVQSAGGLQWLTVLLYKVAQPDNVPMFTSKCVSLLTKIANELQRRTNPYHLLLRSRYGLYGTPLEPELFDVEPPPPTKPSSTTVTYASVVSGENGAQNNPDFHTNYSFYKENLDPKDVLSTTSSEPKIKLKHVSPSRMVRGLLETEPLHFTCIAASDGTRIERADFTGSSFQNNLVSISTFDHSTPVSGGTKKEDVELLPVVVNSIFDVAGPSGGGGTKKEDIEMIINEFAEVAHAKKEKMGQGSNNVQDINNKNAVMAQSVYEIMYHTDKGKSEEDFSKLISDALEIRIESGKKPKSNSLSKQQNMWRVEEIMSPNRSLPWQQLLIPPAQQVIVVERMQSGARRFVTLDFGQPVLLTDVLMPLCHDLVSLSVDLWLKGEDVDCMRLVNATDIGSRNLVLSNLQPPPLCRYLKITTVGRYGMSTARCRIPTGFFYGHLIVLPEEVPPNCSDLQGAITADIEEQLNVLTKLFEDVSCRYSLACSKLKDMLHTFLMADVTNASHLAAYMGVMRDKTSVTSTENGKIFAAYQEAVTYQRQLNTVRNVMCRIERSLKRESAANAANITEACSDKLRTIAESLLDVLLSVNTVPDVDYGTCRQLFQGLCISQTSRVQFLAATLLDRSCGKKLFWGGFLADTLAQMFSSSYSETFPQDRVFILLAYLCRKCPERSTVLDATLKVIAETLAPLAQSRRALLAVTVDLQLLGWLLMFVSLQLDLNKGCLQQSVARWDWVIGEIVGKNGAEASCSGIRKKLHKKYFQYKQHLDNLDWTQKVVHSSAQVQALSALSNHAANLTSKLEAALKNQENFLKKIKQYKWKDKNVDAESSNGSSKPSASKRRREPTEATNESKQSGLVAMPYVDTTHCLVVAKGLLNLILVMDHSCSADIFLLSCKVIARLVSISKIKLGQLMNEEQLLKLIHLCIDSELPWAPHALACLLQDVLEVARPVQTDTEMETETPTTSTSTSWANSDLLSDVESLCESFGLEDNLLSEPVLKQGKTSVGNNNNNNNNHLPSVYESDDSELEDFLDDILERGRTLLKKSSKGAHSPSGSFAMDSRLEAGVEISVEVSLRKLMIASTTNLIQNINSVSTPSENEIELPTWTSNLSLPWQMQPQSPSTNSKMLVGCFESLFRDIHMQSSTNLEHILQLWLTLNCLSGDDKFDPSVVPFIGLSPEAVNSLVSAIAWSSGMSLRTWCTALQTLTLVCNLTQGLSNVCGVGQWSDIYGMYGMTACLVNHPDFVQLLIRLLSGAGLVFSDKGLAGPSLCKALHDFLVRLQMRCDVISSTSQPGSTLKSLLLKVIYQLVQPAGPLASRQGPLDAQCKLLQSMVYLDYTNADLSIAMSILESTAILVHSYVSAVDRIKCVNIGEHLSPTSNCFSGIFASVLGSDANKQDRPVSWDCLLIMLLKLLSKLVQTPLPLTGEQPEAMETETTVITSQTDESKAEQIHQDHLRNNPPVPCLADTVLQHHPSIIRFCQALAACKASTLSMLANISQPSSFPDIGESSTVGDAVFNVLASLAKKASRKELVMEPLLIFLSRAPQLSEPLLWFVLEVLDNEDALRSFMSADGVRILGRSLVASSNAPNTVSHAGSVSMVMQHFRGASARSDASSVIAATSATKKMQQARLENTLSLVNFAPFGSIRCQSGTAQPADVLIQGNTAMHRRARTPQWSYHFYPEEAHTELTLQLPSAILLREVHLQPHLSALATCPSAVALEVSADGPSRLVPACPPLPTSGMTFIRLHLPVPEVVNCIQLRLYKPRDANNIGLSQIRVLGTSAFGGNIRQVLDLSEDESHCKYSLGWLRLLHHCFNLSENSDFGSQVVASVAQVPDLLSTCCGLLLVPTHVPALYLPNLEKVLCKLALYDRDSGLNAIRILLESRSSISEPLSAVVNLGRGPLILNSAGSQSACELLYQICSHQDSDTPYRVALVLEWLQSIAELSLVTRNTENCSPVYVSAIAYILWSAKQSNVSYNLTSMITVELFWAAYRLQSVAADSLKYSLDSLLCSLCYIKPELFPMLLQEFGIRTRSLESSIADDSTDDTKQTFETDSECRNQFLKKELLELNFTTKQFETIALVSRSPTAIRQLLDSGLPRSLTSIILEFCSTRATDKADFLGVKYVTDILKFFTNLSEEKPMRDWLGSSEGSSFWFFLLSWLCEEPFMKKSSLQSEAHAQLEEVCVKFLSKCCLCHPENQEKLATVLCEVMRHNKNGISGFMRRLILQLLLENEKIPVSVKADETLYKNSSAAQVCLPLHPAYKQTHDRALLYLSTNVTLAEILENLSFTVSLKNDPLATGTEQQREAENKSELAKGWCTIHLSMAAGVTAKDKRAKDAKNHATATPQTKKKRYTSSGSTGVVDVIEGRMVTCDAVPNQPLPLVMTLAHVLRLIESKGMTPDWPCVHLTICRSKDDKNNKSSELNPYFYEHPFSNALQVFSSMGGLALLAEHLPTVYPETVHLPQSEKTSTEQSESDWVKIEGSDDIYEDIEVEATGTNSSSKSSSSVPNVPPHSLAAFGLFLRLPGYAEVLLKDRKTALCLLRLVLGVTDDGEGGDIFQTAVADLLPTLPFKVLRRLYDVTPLSTDDGRLLRKISINIGVVHLLLACLGIFTHQTSNSGEKDSQKESKAKDDRQLYWAKGTGFGTGSTQQSWNVEQALMKQKSEEEHVTVLLQVLASYINPGGQASEELAENVLPPTFHQLLSSSVLLPALYSYLRNDSALDMSRHIPLYRAALQLLRAIATSSQLVTLLLTKNNDGPSISSLLKNMKTCVNTYASKLRFNSKLSNMKNMNKIGEQLEEIERDEGLAMLMPDIQATANMVCQVTDRLTDLENEQGNEVYLEKPVISSLEERYLKVMKQLQFDTFEMITELPEGGYKFVVSHHFESNARLAGEQSHPARVKRLAQEAVTLATSLPLSYSSSVFVRCDTDRLDIMKVLITGPADTPYSNGCFELDVFFPSDYPSSPMMINLETTGHHKVRFNPNLYNDGKVCLSVLNTWHGRPEEKWNAQTSSFLQVLVSIQSLILVPEPYFNEPGYERSRGTPLGTQSSKEYNANICQATVRWAMLEQIVNPCPCFKDVIHTHFYLKQKEIVAQVEGWIKDLENDVTEKRTSKSTNKRTGTANIEMFKKSFSQLKERLARLEAPEGLEEVGEESESNAVKEVTNEIDTDIDMEKMVNDMCEIDTLELL